jgi:drug/metabolite transporter (DMT)-like permease
MLITVISVFAFVKLTKIDYKIPPKDILKILGIGAIISFHWVTFFLAIKVSNVSITLAGLSTAAFFVSFIEPLFYKRKPVLYEIMLGAIVIVGIVLIMDVDDTSKLGLLIAMLSAFLSGTFSVMTGKIANKFDSSVITLYQMAGGVIMLSILMPFVLDEGEFGFPEKMDLIYLVILAVVCTAYTFIAIVKIMRTISAFTVVLTINLEPVYGIVMAFFIFGESETMSPKFYLGTMVILSTVFINSYLKGRNVKKKIEEVNENEKLKMKS